MNLRRRTLAGEVGTDQGATLLWLALADRAGLLGLGDGGYRPARRFDDWRADEACARWVVLAEAWQRLGQQRTDPVPPPLPPDTLRRGDTGLREGIIAVLTELPEGSAVVGDLAAVLAWRLPSADTSPARVAAVLAETELLGLTAGAALSALGRGVVAGHAEQAARAVFPTAASTVALQADLTAVAGGPVSCAPQSVPRSTSAVSRGTSAESYEPPASSRPRSYSCSAASRGRGGW